MVAVVDRDPEAHEAAARSAPPGKAVHKAILKEGEEALGRSSAALFWSALAAGLSMGLSMIAEGLLTAHLPDAGWRPLVAKFGYTAGFLVVILGRQQLYTESTLSPVLPVLDRRPGGRVGNLLRLWGVVLAANLLGALAVALVATRTAAFDPHVREAFAELGRKSLEPGFGTVLLRAVFAGWLIGLMAWLLPFAETGRVWVIIFVTYLVGVGHFSHIVAGSVETFGLAATGQAGWAEVIGGYVVPTLIGNTLGGVLLVAVLNHAQVVAGGGRSGS